ncbi:ABC transporter permease [Streptomyces lunaelactis]|uniref:ABC transporter permease n=1 Tax=Streptomyces lunaelactis TaxID=1535768 RepID=UPI00158570D0|nr:ABC transporter permease [Streptomyces lunaelactis]NUK05098.1 ABC transporter permease [Streptomyces lunaelactis]NUK11774.1 ABC transporter permease [Streptomyces lunaelactis]NUK18584.1 ABC transporter permease [Streptomyces lunaelactis]NUK36489.1 ABC transporter permease [Streptomyces lunaelactis]NUK42320.1 ABC transporter permease [Streptomyces lunaelactis]
MTAPLTPPHQPHQSSPNSPNPGPWQSPPTGHAPAYATDAEETPDLRTELRDAAVVLVAVTIAGVALGLLWLWLAPRVPLISNDKAVFLKDTEGEEAVGADGTFALLALGFGAVSAAAVFWFRRRGGIALVVALALGGLLGSLLAWGIGTWFGPTDDVVAHARAVGEGVTFDAPLELKAYGTLLAWPVAAMVVHLAVTALFGPRDPEPEWPPTPYGPPPGA